MNSKDTSTSMMSNTEASPSPNTQPITWHHLYGSSSSSTNANKDETNENINENDSTTDFATAYEPTIESRKASTVATMVAEQLAPPKEEEAIIAEETVLLDTKSKKTVRFWIIFGSLMAVAILTAIDLTIISTTLPTIVKDLPVSTISASWVTAAFLLTTTAFQPFMGGLADVMGRRNTLVLAVTLFLLGSLIAALAKSMLVLVVGRAVQGVGGGGIQALAEIIISDLTTLKERGIYVGLIGLVFAVASFVSPVLGGVFSQHNWRWVFWINLPIGGFALALIIPCMKLNTPPMAFSKKIQRMDLIANAFLFAGMVGVLVGITEGGIKYPWSNWRIVLALVGGIAALIIFFLLEFIPNRFAKDPVLPLHLFGNRTAAACFLMTFFHGLITYGEIYTIPVYFQALKDATPLQSAIDLFPATAPGPISAILAGVIMAMTGKYRFQISFWWAVTAVGAGLLLLLDIDTPKWQWALFQIITGFGVGALFTLTLPPIQSSLPIEEIAHATAAFAFCRSFGSVWGIAMGTNVFIGTINGKLMEIPGVEQVGLSGSTSLGFATELQSLPVPLIQPVKEAFQYALNRSFLSFIPIAIVGFLISLFVKDLPLPDFDRTHHGIQQNQESEESRREKGSTPKQGDKESGSGYGTWNTSSSSSSASSGSRTVVSSPRTPLPSQFTKDDDEKEKESA